MFIEKVNNKKSKLISLLMSVVLSSEYKDEIDYLLQIYNVSLQDLTKEFLHYNYDIDAWDGNKVYEYKEIRLVLHIHNLIKGSWHQERQQTMMNFVSLAAPKSVADIAFGVPSLYMKMLLKNDSKISGLTLFDKEEYALNFAKLLLQRWNNQWHQKITLKYTDMDKMQYVGDYDLYIFQDAIEHVKTPAEYLDMVVKNSPKNSKFLLSLPIGPLLNMHYIAWETTQDAITWIQNRNLVIEMQHSVFVNPEVDLFSEQISNELSDLYLLCRKK